MNKSWIANGFTAANALFGGLSIMMSISGEYHVAAICILIAMAADAFDGRVARALGTAGPMGGGSWILYLMIFLSVSLPGH